jgi:hypothetical protein
LWDSQMIEEGRGIAPPRKRVGLGWPLSVGGRAPVGTCLSMPHRTEELGRRGATVRRAGCGSLVASSRDQSSSGHWRAGHRRSGSGSTSTGGC